MNKTSDMSPSVLRETLKAYIRGQIISYASHEKKQKQEKLIGLTHHIALVDSLLRQHRMYMKSPFTFTSMQSGECLGPDGYPVDFYRKFITKIIPELIMYNESFMSLNLLNQTYIRVNKGILKKSKILLPVSPVAQLVC